MIVRHSRLCNVKERYTCSSVTNQSRFVRALTTLFVPEPAVCCDLILLRDRSLRPVKVRIAVTLCETGIEWCRRIIGCILVDTRVEWLSADRLSTLYSSCSSSGWWLHCTCNVFDVSDGFESMPQPLHTGSDAVCVVHRGSLAERSIELRMPLPWKPLSDARSYHPTRHQRLNCSTRIMLAILVPFFRKTSRHARLTQSDAESIDNETLLPSAPATLLTPRTSTPGRHKEYQVALKTLVICSVVYLSTGFWIAHSVRKAEFVTDADGFCIRHISQYCKLSHDEARSH